MSTAAPEPHEYVPAVVARPPAPAEEVAGPAVSPLVLELRHALRAELALLAQARLEAREQLYRGLATDQTDASGDALLELFSVPGGATGYLMRAVVDEDASAVTPAAPDTNANLWLAVYGASGPGITDPAQVRAAGLLACSPNTPAVDAQIPCELVRSEHRESAPALVGPGTFYLIVDAATAARRLVCRWQVLVERPEP